MCGVIVLFFFAGAGEGSVQAAQRGQVGVQIIKRPAANYPWLPLGGLRSRGAVLNWFPVGTKTRACPSRSETAVSVS